MTTITIGNLTQLPTAQDTTVFAVQDGALTRKLTALSLKNYMSSLGNISVSGNISVGGIATNSVVASTIQAGVLGNVGAILTGTLNTASQTNITSVGTLINLIVSGTFNVGSNVNLTGNLVSTNAASFSAINNTVIGNVSHSSGRFTTVIATAVNAGTIGNTGTTLTGTLNTAAQPNITSVGALTSLAVTGNVTAGNVSGTKGTFTQVAGTVITSSQPNITSVGSLASLTVTGDISSSTLATSGNATVGNISGTKGTFTQVAGTVQTASQPNITSLGTLTSIGVSGSSALAAVGISGNLTLTGTVTSDIIPTANLTYNLGSSTSWWNNIYGVSVQAKYADLAEKYTSDSEYTPGTVVVFGGSNEITVSSESHTPTVAGVISSAPAYLMNSAITGLPVALSGRVPCRVQGPVNKGDRLVNLAPGIAGRLDLSKYTPGCVIGHALETLTSDEIKLIEVVIMKF